MQFVKLFILAGTFLGFGLNGVENIENSKKKKIAESEDFVLSKNSKLSLKSFTVDELMRFATDLDSKDEVSLKSIKDFIKNNPEILKKKLSYFARGSEFFQFSGMLESALKMGAFFSSFESDIECGYGLLLTSLLSSFMNIVDINQKDGDLSDTEKESIIRDLDKTLEFVQFLFNNYVFDNCVKLNASFSLFMKCVIKIINNRLPAPMDVIIQGINNVCNFNRSDSYLIQVVSVICFCGPIIDSNGFVKQVMQSFLNNLLVSAAYLQESEEQYNAQYWQMVKNEISNTLVANGLTGINLSHCLNLFDEIEKLVSSVSKITDVLLDDQNVGNLDTLLLEFNNKKLSIAIKRLVFTEKIELNKLMNVLFSNEENIYNKVKAYFDSNKDDFVGLLEALRKFKHGLVNPDIAKSILLGHSDSDHVLNSVEWNAYTLVRARKLKNLGKYFRSWSYYTLAMVKRLGLPSDISANIATYNDTMYPVVQSNHSDAMNQSSVLSSLSKYVPSLSDLNPFYLAKVKLSMDS